MPPLWIHIHAPRRAAGARLPDQAAATTARARVPGAAAARTGWRATVARSRRERASAGPSCRAVRPIEAGSGSPLSPCLAAAQSAGRRPVQGGGAAARVSGGGGRGGAAGGSVRDRAACAHGGTGDRRLRSTRVGYTGGADGRGDPERAAGGGGGGGADGARRGQPRDRWGGGSGGG